MSSTEFACHIYALDENEEAERKTRKKWEYYAAQICQVMVQLKVPKEKVKLDEFFFDYTKPNAPVEKTEEQKQLDLKMAKNRWAMFTGGVSFKSLLNKKFKGKERGKKHGPKHDPADASRKSVDERVTLHEPNAAGTKRC